MAPRKRLIKLSVLGAMAAISIASGVSRAPSVWAESPDETGVGLAESAARLRESEVAVHAAAIVRTGRDLLAGGTTVIFQNEIPSGGNGSTTVNATGILAVGDQSYAGATAASITAGTLAIYGSGSLNPGVSMNVKTGTTFDISLAVNNQTISGSLTGSGGLTKTGFGVLTLTGINTYTGATLINGGVLQIGNGTTSGSGGINGSHTLAPGTIYDQSVLAIDHSDTVTINNTITTIVPGTGNFVQIGTGVTILTANNSYGGQTLISAGTLQIGNGGTTGSLGVGSVFDNSHLVFDLSGYHSFTEALIGTGTLSIAGPGTIALNAPDLITGVTFIGRGSQLVIGLGGYLGNTTMIDNGNLTFATLGTTLQNGNISGTGSVTLNGPGSLVLSNESYQGATEVVNGTLFLYGFSHSDELNVDPRGRVMGAFQTTGSVYNSGQLLGAPSGGNIEIAGSYRQAATGVYVDAINGSLISDSMNVQGVGILNGALAVSSGSRELPLLGESFVAINASGGLVGRFTDVSSPASLGLAVNYGAHAVTMTETKNLFEDAATAGDGKPSATGPKIPGNPALLTSSELSMARALDAFVLRDGFTDRNSPVLAFLDRASRTGLKDDFDLLSPESLSSLYQGGFAESTALGANIDAQMDNLHAGAAPASAITPSADGKSLITSSTTSGDRIGLWVSGDAEFTSIGGSAGAAGYNVLTSGVVTGVDYKPISSFILGAYFDYVNTNAGLAGSGSLRANGGKIGAYTTVYGHGFYFNAMGGGGASSFNASRQTLGGLASGSSNATDTEVHLTAGYDAHVSNFTISPFASFQDSRVDLQAYKEHGSLAPLQILDSGASDVRTDVGVKLSYAAQYRGALIRPYLHAAWEHAYSSSQDTVCAKLPGGSRSIASESPYLGADGAVIGGGVTVDFRSFTFFLSDEYRTGRAGYSSNIINGGMRTGF